MISSLDRNGTVQHCGQTLTHTGESNERLRDTDNFIAQPLTHFRDRDAPFSGGLLCSVNGKTYYAVGGKALTRHRFPERGHGGDLRSRRGPRVAGTRQAVRTAAS